MNSSSSTPMDRDSLEIDASHSRLLGGLTIAENFQQRRSRRPWSLSHLLFAALFFVGCALSFMLGKGWNRGSNSGRVFPPMLANQEFTSNFHLTQYNSSILSPSPFHGKPSPELDHAWVKLAELNYLRVQKEDISKSGSNTNAIKFSDESGGGYMAALEAVFHIHCLDEIRKSLYYNYEHYKDDSIFHEPMFDPEYRVNNCIEVIRQALMCKADSTIIPFYWVKDYPIPLPNWNTWHMCQNYDSLIEWSEEHATKMPSSLEELRQSAVYEFPAVPEPDMHSRPPR